MTEHWLRIDERGNAIDSLEMAGVFLEQIPPLIKWKWVIIAMQQALYGFAILAIKGTYPRKRVMGKDGKRLITIWEALRRCEDPQWMKQHRDSKVLARTQEEATAIRFLVSEFRNNFEHFQPAAWSIEVSGMPRVVNHVIHVIRFLALESNNVLLGLIDAGAVAPVIRLADVFKMSIQRVDLDRPHLTDLDAFDVTPAHQVSEALRVVPGVLRSGVDGHAVVQHHATTNIVRLR
jgi:hypothetical protein